jgi:hypothetical protein
MPRWWANCWKQRSRQSTASVVLAHALVDHVLAHAPAARVGEMRARGQVLVLKHGPHAEHFQAFGFVGIDQELIAHTSAY